MATEYPTRLVFAPSDALRKIEREVEALRIEVMSINNLINMDPRLRAAISKAKAQATLERIKPIVHEAEMQKILRDRRKRIHARAKRILEGK